MISPNPFGHQVGQGARRAASASGPSARMLMRAAALGREHHDTHDALAVHREARPCPPRCGTAKVRGERARSAPQAGREARASSRWWPRVRSRAPPGRGERRAPPSARRPTPTAAARRASAPTEGAAPPARPRPTRVARPGVDGEPARRHERNREAAQTAAGTADPRDCLAAARRLQIAPPTCTPRREPGPRAQRSPSQADHVVHHHESERRRHRPAQRDAGERHADAGPAPGRPRRDGRRASPAGCRARCGAARSAGPGAPSYSARASAPSASPARYGFAVEELGGAGQRLAVAGRVSTVPRSSSRGSAAWPMPMPDASARSSRRPARRAGGAARGVRPHTRAIPGREHSASQSKADPGRRRHPARRTAPVSAAASARPPHQDRSPARCRPVRTQPGAHGHATASADCGHGQAPERIARRDRSRCSAEIARLDPAPAPRTPVHWPRVARAEPLQRPARRATHEQAEQRAPHTEAGPGMRHPAASAAAPPRSPVRNRDSGWRRSAGHPARSTRAAPRSGARTRRRRRGIRRPSPPRAAARAWPGESSPGRGRRSVPQTSSSTRRRRGSRSASASQCHGRGDVGRSCALTSAPSASSARSAAELLVGEVHIAAAARADPAR